MQKITDATHVEKIISRGYWKNGDLKAEDAIYTFSKEAQKEVKNLVQSLPQEWDLEGVDVKKYDLSHFSEEMEKIRKQVEEGIRFAILGPIEGINPLEQGIVPWLAGTSLGRALDQDLDQNGNLCTKLYRIFDRGKKIEEGARYSYTNQGGDSHTDNVNTEEYWHYLVLLSVFPSMAGGGNTMVSGLVVHDLLKEKYPEQLEVLKQPILWERKGIADDTFYEAPVITYQENGEPNFRWLPSYAILSNKKAVKMGYQGANPLTKEQQQAFDLLIALTQTSELQFQGVLPQGYTLITNDNQIFHEREHFADYLNAVIPELKDRNYNPEARYGRLRYRMWIQKSS